MSERSERLLSAMTEVGDEKLEEALDYRKKRRRSGRHWFALAAVLVLVIGAGSFMKLIWGGCGSGTGGGGDRGGFLSYAGPVLPLTTKEPREELTASRQVTLDFEPWVPQWVESEQLDIYPEGGYWAQGQDLLVYDDYRLTNRSEESQSVTLLYPFVSSLQELLTGEQKYRPRLLLEGGQLETGLRVGGYVGSYTAPVADEINPLRLDSWEKYQKLLESGEYRRDALLEGADLSRYPVTVYELTVPPYEGEKLDAPATLRVGFDADAARTTFLTVGNHGMMREDGRTMLQISIDDGGRKQTQTAYVLVLGDDVTDFSTDCVIGRKWDSNEPLPDYRLPEVKRYSSDLQEMLGRTLALMLWQNSEEDAPWYTEEGYLMMYRVSAEMLDQFLSRRGTERVDSAHLGMLCSEALQVERVCYLEADVTIPAGTSVQLSARMYREPSVYYGGQEQEQGAVRGYDLMTTVDSMLDFSGQSAVLEDRGQIQLLQNDFGFDLEAGIRTAELDLNVPHYNLEVRPASDAS